MANSDSTAAQAGKAEKAVSGPEPANEFEAVKERLEEIVRAVEDDEMPLDDALDLYEEAVKLGLQVSSLLESAIAVEDEPVSEGAADSADASAGASDSADSATSAVAAE